MNLLLHRELPANGCTLGRLSIDGEFECWTLEDLERAGPKVPGRSAIPAGIYSVRVTFSPGFATRLPRIVSVPEHEAVYFLPGITQDETPGSILVGRDKGKAAILRNRVAFPFFLAKLEGAEARGEPITLRILSRQAPAG